MTAERDLRPDPGMEQRVSSWLDDADLTPDEAERGLDRVLRDFPVTPQTRRRFLGRWLDRDEGARRRTSDRDHPPDQDTSRNRLMFSASGLVAALAMLALAVSVVNPDDQARSPAAEGGATRIVAADGSGDFTTITEAIEDAADGDAILVRPGDYAGPMVIDKDIAITGDGHREDIVVRWTSDSPTKPFAEDEDLPGDIPYGLLIRDANAAVSSLTLSGPDTGVSVVLSGGMPVIDDVIIDMGPLPDQPEDRGTAFYVAGGSAASILGSAWDGYLAVRGGASPTIAGNTITANIVSIDGPGTTMLLDNMFVSGARTSLSEGAIGLVEGNDFSGGGIGIDTGSDVVVRGNVIRHAQGRRPWWRSFGVIDIPDGAEVLDLGPAISVSGAVAQIIDNTVSGARLAIAVDLSSSATVSGNELLDNRIAINAAGAEMVVEDNVIRGGGAGIITTGDPTLIGNDVEGVSNRGIAIAGGGNSPRLSGNRSCGNGENLWVATNARPEIDDDNEICEDAPTE